MSLKQLAPVWFYTDDYPKMCELLEKHSIADKIFILCDTHTQTRCLSYFRQQFSTTEKASVIVIPAGESHKTPERASEIWQNLLTNEAGRQSLLINLGGGMITDLGAFAASLFKRGISYIHVPTTLLAMTDAAIGGKSAVNINSYKNQVGNFSDPLSTYIDVNFLKSLSEEELKNGFAEMLKHGIIADEKYFSFLEASGDFTSETTLRKSIAIKSRIAEIDFYDKGPRKLLNFGHTIGHAIESFMATAGNEVSHGRAVAAGMICESYISYCKNMLGKNELERIEKNIRKHFSFDFWFSYENIKPYLFADKKNTAGKINFALPEAIGKGKIDVTASPYIIHQSITFLFRPEVSNGS